VSKDEFIKILQFVEKQFLVGKRQGLTLSQAFGGGGAKGNFDDHLWLIENNYLPPYDEIKTKISPNEEQLIIVVWNHSEGQSGLEIDNKELLSLYQKNEVFCTRWNATVLKIYNGKKSKPYREAVEKYNFWFDRRYINPKDIELLYTETRSSTGEKKTKMKEPGPIKKTKLDNLFRCDGDMWTIRYRGVTKTIKSTGGMHLIAHLLRNPGQEIKSISLYQDMLANVIEKNSNLSNMTDEALEEQNGLNIMSDNLMDPTDKASIQIMKDYQNKINEELSIAEMQRDKVTENKLNNNIKMVENWLSKVTDKSGEMRETQDIYERVRKAVWKAIDVAKNNIKKHLPDLYKHLNKYIKTGNTNSYIPTKTIGWFVER